MKKILGVVLFFVIFIAVIAFLFFVRPPGEPIPDEKIHAKSPGENPILLSEGRLPGITWVDDIHPIFVRNKCGHCHTRGKEAIAEGFEELSLGIIDPEDENNAYYSYHELVYAEGPPQIQEGGHGDDGSEVQGQRQYDIRPFYQRVFLNLSLWLGESRNQNRIRIYYC